MTEFSELLRRLPAASPLPFALHTKRCLRLDLSAANPQLRDVDPADTPRFTAWVSAQIAAASADYAAGGYLENRQLYAMSQVFGSDADEARTLHLGIDLWLTAGTAVHAVLPGVVHSSADNAAFGDYGPTLILEHHAEDACFYTLYGHLTRPTLMRIHPGQAVAAGELLGWLGDERENGGWPPHLHFQIIRDMAGYRGDHPGVCKASEAALWQQRCPDPNLLLRLQP